MKKKFKKKLLFYVILLLITFCISHFVNADTNNKNLLGLDIVHNLNGQIITTNLLNNNFIYNQDGTNYIFSNGDLNFYNINIPQGDYIFTDKLSFYFDSPCTSNESLSYNIKISFFLINGYDFYNLLNVSVINGISGCSGSFSRVGNRFDYNLSCSLEKGSYPSGSLYFDYSSPSGINSKYRIGIQKDFSYSCNVSNQAIIDANNNNTNNIINNQNKNQEKTNQKLDNINSSLTDSSPISIEELNASAGWLPEGPLDSILNLPLSLLNNLSTNLNKQCTPVSLTIPFIDKNNTLVLPCLANTLSDNVENFDSFYTWLGLTVSCILLYRYLMSLYVWVDKVLTLRLQMYEDFGGDPHNFGSV